MKDTEESPGLTLLEVSKTYRKASSRTPANRAISLNLHPGELVALIGHNGAGKTTLLNQVVGTTRPDSGDIRYGADSLVAAPDLARRVSSMMLQLHAPLTGVTPAQAITSIARLRGGSSAEAQRAAEALIDVLDIGQWRRVPGEKLSGGLRRLTSYAMSVVIPPPVLLIDEPTNDVDPVRRPLIWGHLRRLADAGHIVIVVTHNLNEVERTADRYVLLEQGQVVADSSPRRLAAESGTTTLTITLSPDADTGDAPEALAAVRDDTTGQLRLSLEAAQVPAAVDWVLRLVADRQVDTYTLTPASLEALYEGFTHAS